MGASSDRGLKDRSAGRGVAVAVIPHPVVSVELAMAIKKKNHGMAWVDVTIAKNEAQEV